MSDYIKREDAYVAIHEQYPHLNDAGVHLVINTIPAADVVERPHWIPVTERLPEPYKPVLCYGCGGTMVDYYSGENTELYNTPLFMICEGKATHWLPLPEPPKEVDT